MHIFSPITYCKEVVVAKVFIHLVKLWKKWPTTTRSMILTRNQVRFWWLPSLPISTKLSRKDLEKWVSWDNLQIEYKLQVRPNSLKFLKVSFFCTMQCVLVKKPYFLFLDSRNDSQSGTLKSGSIERQRKVLFPNEVQGNNLLVPVVDSPKRRRRSFTDFVRKLSPKMPPMSKNTVSGKLRS